MIDLFGNVSGLKLNYSKTEALLTGSNSHSDFKLCPEKNSKQPRTKVKALGVWLSTDPDLTLSLHYKDKLDKNHLRMLETTQSGRENYGPKKPCRIPTNVHFFTFTCK